MYYITLNNQTIGPMSAEQMMAYNVTNETPVSRDGGEWQPLYTYPELMERYPAWIQNSSAGERW